MSDPVKRIVGGILPRPKHCPHTFELLKEDEEMIKRGLAPEAATSRRIRTTCPSCGSKNVRIGCPYQDCPTCADVEMSSCNTCGAGWGGAMYTV